MMNDPSICSLLEKVEDRYTLCIMVGKRARQLTDGAKQLSKCSSNKTVSIASHEINDGKVFKVQSTEE